MGIRSQRGTAALTGRRGRRPLRNGSPRFALVEAASSTLPAAFQKENTILTDGVSFFSRSAQQNRRGSNSLPGIPRMAEPFAGALPSPPDLTRFALVEAASSILPAAFQKETPSCRMVFLFGAGDEARTRYLDLGKVALYQMSYARKRKIDYTSHRSVCQPRFPNFRKKLMPALAGGHAGIYRMMISTTPGLSALG